MKHFNITYQLGKNKGSIIAKALHRESAHRKLLSVNKDITIIDTQYLGKGVLSANEARHLHNKKYDTRLREIQGDTVRVDRITRDEFIERIGIHPTPTRTPGAGKIPK